MHDRVLLAGLGGLLLVLLLLARLLTPEPNGFGTHEQLGLPPCTFVQLVGCRCPSCGMTTAWAYATRGNLVRSAQANAGGTLLAVFALVALPWSLASAWRGRWLYGRPAAGVLVALAGIVILVTLAQWAVLLIR